MYKLNTEKIKSPIVLIMPDGEQKQFKDGVELSNASFQDRYIINTIKAVNNNIEITVSIADRMPQNYIDSFF
ncbi:MAG: hypothetical protein IJP69_09030 [Synergistaceae bacterium]|nr:hypothetical protein [Synergistaceae bacterium]